MNRGKSLRQQQQEWGLDLTGPEPVPMVQGETGDAAPPESISVPPYGQWGIDLTGAEPRPMAVEESQWGLDLTGGEPVPMMDYESPEAPPPGAAQPAPITASSRATRGSLVDQLAAPITQDERAVLEDPRASARAQAMRQMVGSISNRMAALAGLPMQPIGESPFVSERDKLRQFILQRGGVAERQAAGEEGRDIRRERLAAAETARLRSEKAAALARGDAMAAREADRKLKEVQAQTERYRAETERMRAETTRKAMERKGAAPSTAKAPAGGEPKKKELPPSMVAEFASYDAATSALDRLLNSFESKGMDSTAAKAAGLATNVGITNTDAGQYIDEMRSAMQGAGTILENGKLAAGDEVKYAKLMPQPGDSLQRARAKIDNLKRLLQEKRTRAYQDLEAAGYRTPQAEKPKQDSAAAPAAVADKVRVTNGQEVLEIDEADVEAAEADGYKRMP